MIKVSEKQEMQFREEGYMVLEGIIPEDMLVMLREECSYFIGYMDALMDTSGKGVADITHRGKRYFINNRYRLSTRLWQFLYSPLMAEVAQAALGPNAYLFHEQWVVKGAEQGMKFAWHQDSGYLKYQDDKPKYKPFLTCWCPLDDVSEANGTVYILPHSRGGTSHALFDHTKEAGTNDLVGYTGNDPGIPVVAPAGSVVAFTSFNFHRSGANTTPRMRRVYLAQYSSEPVLDSSGQLWILAVPFVKDGKIVYDHATDVPEKYGPFPRRFK